MKNILRNFWVTLTRFKTASILNILGLTVAFAVFMVIMSQTYWELTYNKNIKEHEKIFRVVMAYYDDWIEVTSRPIGETIGNASAAIESYSIVYPRGNSYTKTIETDGQIKETMAICTHISPNFPNLLSLECIAGDFSRLKEPKTAIIPKSVADILFPNADPVGNIIITGDSLQVVAVYKDLPTNSFTNAIYSDIGDLDMNNHSNWNYQYLIKLNSPKAKTDVERQAMTMVKEMLEKQREMNADIYDEEEEGDDDMTYDFYLEPVSNMYFSTVRGFFNETGNLVLTHLLISISFIIILIAIINYINFFMALVPIRIRSVNINKVFGTPTASLRMNIIGEAVGLLLLSFGLALLVVHYLSGSFINDLVLTTLNIKDNLFIVILTGVMVVVIGILAGLFPAFYITKFNPALALKGSFGRSKQGQRLRSILVSFQFTISIILIICAGFVYIQSRYMQKFDYGFQRDRLVTVEVGDKIASQPQAFLSELRNSPAIEGIAYSTFPIVNVGMGWGRGYKGEQISYSCLPVSWNYPEFIGLELVEGRFFIEDDASKAGGSYIFNEAAAKKYNICVGEFMGGHNDSEKAEIVGIVKDFNFASLKIPIAPIALYEFGSVGWYTPSMAYIRLSHSADFKQTSEFIASAMQAVNPNIKIDKIKIQPFDKTIEKLYTTEIKLTKVISLFSLVAILISLMGVFGIVVFENQHRRKEIALRKIHGSTATLIVGMFNRKFIYILLISFVIAAPVAYFGVVKWLSGFAYRTPIYGWVFAGGFLVVTLITLLTVTLQTLSVANENPIRAIKAE